jgi:5S rRNA maturation endonuclease (ribonuclease M5)
MSLDKESMIRELQRVPNDRSIVIKPDHAKLRCWNPEHKNGQENTPSLKVNLEGRYAGTFFCFGCGLKGGWGTLASHFGLRGASDRKGEDLERFNLRGKSSDIVKELTPQSDELSEKRELVMKSPLFPKNETWRGIRGWLLRDIGARIVFDDFGPQVYLPITMNGEWTSGVYCSWEKRDRSYINETDPRIKRSLFPYDYTKSLLKKLPKGKRAVMLVEGPRDALNLLQNDIPAMAALGGITVWNENKLSAVVDTYPDAVVLGFDPDDIGRKLTKAVKKGLKENGILCKRFKMEVRELANGKVHKQDPGNLNERDILRLKKGIENMLKRG